MSGDLLCRRHNRWLRWSLWLFWRRYARYFWCDWLYWSSSIDSGVTTDRFARVCLSRSFRCWSIGSWLARHSDGDWVNCRSSFGRSWLLYWCAVVYRSIAKRLYRSCRVYSGCLWWSDWCWYWWLS